MDIKKKAFSFFFPFKKIVNIFFFLKAIRRGRAEKAWQVLELA